MKSYFGTYHSGRTIANEATVLLFSKNISIGFRNENDIHTIVNWALKDIEATYDRANDLSRISHNNGREYLAVEGKQASEEIIKQQQENRKPWYQKDTGRQWFRNAVLFTCFITILFFLYILIVPWLSERMSGTVSKQTEARFGETVYQAMDLSSRIDPGKTALVNMFFEDLKIESAYNIRISVVNDAEVNAFALPGGRIVIYTGLLSRIETYPELAAVLSHEYIHVNNRHATKSIFRKLGSKIFLALLFGKMGTVASILTNNADDIKSLSYSRRLEKEADAYGLNLLMERNIDPSGFIVLFEHLKKFADHRELPEFLGSHPDLEKRIQYIIDASKNAVVKENLQLRTIFEKLKQK